MASHGERQRGTIRDGGAIWIIQRAGIDRAWTGGSTLTARVFWLIGEAGTVVQNN